MIFIVCTLIVVAGLAYWAYRHGKLTGELAAVKAYVSKLEGGLSSTAVPTVPVVPVAALPTTTVVQKQSAISQITKSLAALKSQAGVQ